MNFRPDIQGLRAIAVLAVIIFHLNPAWLPGGFIGVDIFLVISGFLISSILLHKKSKPEYKLLPTLSYFYSSRIKRIAPAYYTTLIVISVIAAVLFLPADFSIYRDGLKKAAYFNSNNYFANFGDYFAPANHEQPLLHTWSLAIEIQFYLLAPFIFLLLPKRLLNWGLPISIIGLTAYAEYQLRIAGNQQATYYSLMARLPAFFLGAWVALLIGKSNELAGGGRRKLSLTWLAAGLIALALALPKITGHFPGLAGLLPTVGAALIILLNANNRLTQLLSNKTLVWTGALSYSLYLWHWPVLAFMRYYTGAEILNWQYSLAFAALTLALATASYYWIETPLRLKRSKKQVIGYASLALLLVLTIVGMKKINAYYTPEPLPVEYTRYADPETICHGQIVGDCLKGDLNSDTEVLVLGDSHAAMLNHFFDYLGKELGFKARIITASSCVTIPGFDYQRLPEWAQADCIQQIEVVKQLLDGENVVFLAGMWSYHYLSNQFMGALKEFLVSKKEGEIILLSQVPLLKHSPQRNMRFKKIGVERKQEFDTEYKISNNYLKEIVKGERVKYVELDNLPTFNKVFLGSSDFLYFDKSHLNELGVMSYGEDAKTEFGREIF